MAASHQLTGGYEQGSSSGCDNHSDFRAILEVEPMRFHHLLADESATDRQTETETEVKRDYWIWSLRDGSLEVT